MKISKMILGLTIAGCSAGLLATPSLRATVSDEDFNTLKDMVLKQGQQLDQLQKQHEQDQQLHTQDQQQISQLQQQLLQTQTLATNAAVKAEAASQIQPIYPVPNPAPRPTHDFLVTGDAEVQYGKATDQHGTFGLADFAPIFLFRANDNALFEAGFDVTLQNNVDANGNPSGGSSTSVDLSFAQLDYLLNDYVTVVAGDMLLPLGTYSERSAGWLNKIPDDPLVRDYLPGSGVGAQLRGATSLGQSGQMLTYSVYGVNGPSSTSTTNANAGSLDLDGNVGDTQNWHANPSGGGRIGWFYPWGLHYDVELGISGQTGEWSDYSGSYLWSAAVLDAAVHLSPYFEVKGEYVNTWQQTDNVGNLNPNGLWVQAAYKLAGLKKDLPAINNLELVGRYDYEDNAQGSTVDRYTAGYVYYISNTLLFEGEYEWFLVHGQNPNGYAPGLFVLQLSLGF